MAEFQFTSDQYRLMADEMRKFGYFGTASVLSTVSQSAAIEEREKDQVTKVAKELRDTFHGEPVKIFPHEQWIKLAKYVIDNFKPA